MREIGQRPHWFSQVKAATSKHRYLKAIGTMLFIALFFAGYFFVLYRPHHAPTLMPVISLDRLIGFQPTALPLYLSLWIYVSLPPALLKTRRELFGYGIAMAATCLTGLVVFYFWPTAVPVAAIDWSNYPRMSFLKSVDATGNACPSLHAATAVFSGVWMHYLLRRCGAPAWLIIFNWAWCVGIIYSALATLQHVAVDVMGGVALGACACALSLRWRPAPDV